MKSSAPSATEADPSPGTPFTNDGYPTSPFNLLPDEMEKTSGNYTQSQLQTSAQAGKSSFEIDKGGGEFQEEYSPTASSSLDSLVMALYISSFAILGALFRIVLAQLFGEECKNPGTVGWLRSESALCITAYGSMIREGGIIYSDIPANILGCFLMGLFLSGMHLGLPVDTPFAVIPTDSRFQSWDKIHFAIRSGFCGSLTTYSSWNSEMIIMIFGTGSNYSTQWIRAFFGYVIGIELSLSSFVAGRNLALLINRALYPAIAMEADTIANDKDVCLNKELPGFERRFLGGILDEEEITNVDVQLLNELSKWKESTASSRENHSDLNDILHTVEKIVIVDNADPRKAYGDIVTISGWDLDALEKWTREKNHITAMEPPQSNLDVNEIFVALPLFAIILAPVILGLIFQSGDDTYSMTYRSMWYSAVWAPPGALLRWLLTGLNGKMNGAMSWLPVGTLIANVIGSIVSVAMIAFEVNLQEGGSFFAGAGTMGAVRIGFAGSLSTVSTFVFEITTLMKGFPQHARGYFYITLSLFTTCALGIIVYGWIQFWYY